jgi:GH24 family phage-related lysozyme (muramidase)
MGDEIAKWSEHWMKVNAAAAQAAGFGADPSSTFAALVAFAKKYGQKWYQADGIAPGFKATRASVVKSFVDWSTAFEGYINYPYTDAEGLVTTGMGDLIDAMAPGQKMHVNCGHGTNVPCGSTTPTGTARALPWTGGSLDADWAKLKASWPHIQSTACKGITSARLSPEAVSTLVAGKMKQNEDYILAHLPSYAVAPADAQLGVHSMSWAEGPGFTGTWTLFRNAFNAGDYAGAAAQSHMRGVGIDMRNLANKLLFLNAAAVKSLGANPDHLYYIDGLTQLVSGAAIATAKAAGAASQTVLAQLVETVKANPGKSAAVGVGIAAAIAAILSRL